MSVALPTLPALSRLLAVGLLALAGAGAADALAPGWTAPRVQAKDGESLSYILFVPQTKPGARYPLVVHLHGNGGGPDELKGNSPILRTLAAPAWQAKEPCFVLGPACPQTKTQPKWVNWPWEKGAYSVEKVPVSISMQLVMAAIDELSRSQPIDPDRIYVTGGSMGGYGAWDAICRYPTRFAGAIPLSGSGDPGCAALIKQVPVHAFAIATDPICPAKGSRDMIAAIKAAGGQPLYTEYPKGWHLWDQVWDPNNKEYWQPELLPWLFAQKRAAAAK